MPAEGDTPVPPEPESEMGSRARTTSLLLIGGGAAIVFLAFGQPWTTARLVDPGLPLLYRDITGRELAPVVGVLPVLLFAAVLALIATVGTVRRVLGGIVCVIAGVLLLTSLRGAPPYIGYSGRIATLGPANSISTGSSSETVADLRASCAMMLA